MFSGAEPLMYPQAVNAPISSLINSRSLTLRRRTDQSMEGKYVVAAVGVGSAAALGIANLICKGPDATVTSAVIAAITFIVGLCFGKVLR